MIDYAFAYRTLCSQLNECDSEEKVRTHNRAMKKLEKLYQKVENMSDKSFLLQLLQDPNLRLRITVAMHCLRLGVYNDEARNALVELSKNSDPHISFTAGACLYTLERKHKKYYNN